MSTITDLDLAQQLLLLVLKDREGSVAWNRPIDLTLGMALLVDLALEERIEIANEQPQLVTLKDATPTGRPHLDRALAEIAKRKNPKGLAWWAVRLMRRSLRHELAIGLAKRGIVKHEERSLMLIFRQHRFPELDSTPEAAVRERIEAALRSEEPLEDAHTACLIALAAVAGGLEEWLDPSFLKERKARLAAIRSGEALAESAVKGITATQAAMVAVAVIPAVTAAVVVNSSF